MKLNASAMLLRQIMGGRHTLENELGLLLESVSDEDFLLKSLMTWIDSSKKGDTVKPVEDAGKLRLEARQKLASAWPGIIFCINSF